ncbi:hypothetical protein HBH43_107630 [Parastagonospora nodorum]|nr:hypothetical protein HBH43_107630 [Parastagonospora nodorum]
MSQTNVREEYKITTLEVVELIEDLTSYVKKKDLLKKIQSEKSQSQLLKSLPKCTQLRNAQIPKVFHEAAVRQYSAKVKTEDLSNTPTPTLSKTAQQQSSSVVSNRSTASITDKFSIASLTKPAILNNANVALVDAVHHSVVKQFPMFRLITKESQQKLEENYFEVRAQHLKYNALIQHLSLPKYSDWYQAGTSQVIDALTMTLIKDDDDLLGTVNSHIKSRRLRAVMLLCQTTKPPVTFQPNEPPEQPSPPKKRADSRHAKASGGRTKKDKDSEDSNTSSDVPRPRRRDRAAARAQSAERKQLGKEAQLKKTRNEEELAKAKKEKEEKEAQKRETYSSDINPKDDSEDEEATTAKDLAREQKERLKALLNANYDFTPYQLTDAYILYFKELSSDNSGIFANAIGIGKTRAIVLATEVQNTRAEGNATEHNAVNDDDKPYPTKGERTFHCACERSPSFNAKPQQAAIMMTTLRFCFFSNSPPENIGRPTKEEAIEMQIDTTNAISKALAAANKLVAPQSYTIPEANTPAVHPKATKHHPALLAARFVIVCSFRKVDKHVFRAYNTISVTAQRTIIRKGGPHVEKRAILLPSHVTALSGTPIEQGLNEILIFVSLALIGLQNRKGVSNWFNATDKRDSVTGDCIYKIEDARNIIANIKHDASEHESSHEYKELISQGAAVAQRFMLKRTLKTRDLCLCPDFLSTVQNAKQQCRDILEKEGLNKSEASRRVIFNRFEMQAIASYPALATLKAAQFKTYSSRKVKRFTLNSVKDLFTNLSKDYFLVREARAITKSSLKFQNLSNLCSERDLDRPWIIVASIAFAEAITLTEATHVLAEMCVGIVYFNSDSKLELKVLGKQDVKTTS